MAPRAQATWAMAMHDSPSLVSPVGNKYQHKGRTRCLTCTWHWYLPATLLPGPCDGATVYNGHDKHALVLAHDTLKGGLWHTTLWPLLLWALGGRSHSRL